MIRARRPAYLRSVMKDGKVHGLFVIQVDYGLFFMLKYRADFQPLGNVFNY
ncbi:hypothetical protein [Alkaliphilus hydrothermalis]|uniref:Uncharacterized protein n=1 Tax=Alkaliphilus hydrothermalis TaxID=1482730 RepID=A0ABS2NU80_9FIRM|nr:hypothetical protein [Alkaliphilus hydrothermalis]MBM7616422.1 hypothetical protein [Alkaliphilus hydrothermalis]